MIDLPDEALDRILAIALHGRILVVVQVLDPDEVSLPFEGSVRLSSLEGGIVVETDVETTRPRYLEALANLQSTWESALLARSARFVRATTTDDPVHVVRRIVEAAR